MSTMMLREAITATMYAEMERDPNLIILGEDIVGGHGTPGGPEAIG
jgi:pyruvate/2-oxoglutarate/acetoin dehydrogenase E1 component